MRKETNLLRKTYTYKGERFDVYGHSEEELLLKKISKLESFKRGEIVHPSSMKQSSMTVNDWARFCVLTYKSNLGEASFENVLGKVNISISKYIGDVKLKDVTPIMCQDCINHQKGKSDDHISRVANLMKFIFQMAVDNELIGNNPAKSIIKPKGQPYIPRRALCKEEQKVFLEALNKDHYALYYMLMYQCGCRPSEARNIEYRDVFAENGKKFLHIRGTKSRAADRNVPLPSSVEVLFPKRKLKTDKVCLTEDGEVITKQKGRTAWKHLSKKMESIIEDNEIYKEKCSIDDLTAYCLRHTYCTNLQKQGVDIRTAQYLMGHSSIQMTANIYTHIGIEQLSNEYSRIVGEVNCGTTAVQGAVQRQNT